MKCDRCGCKIEAGDEMEHLGQVLCEDCYMDMLSPARTCDPWAVHSAKSMTGGQPVLTDIQENILDILGETGGLTPESLAERLGVTQGDIQRELATLRHMEKVRATMKDGIKVFCLW